MKEKIIVAMSGGVDSSAAALLLKNQNYDVTGVTLRLLDNDPDSSVEDAARIADRLSIPHYVLDMRAAFREEVIAPFAEAYLRGLTPNPCILCNPSMKWGKLLAFADQLGASKLATGHYAKVGLLPNGRYSVFRAASDSKDQTYALCRLTQSQLKRTLMPLGELSKDQVRELVKSVDLHVSEKRDSQDICFIPSGDHLSFLKEIRGDENIPAGRFIDKTGRMLGTHQGLPRYTIGQRKGLGLSMGHPVFVTELRPETNEVVIGESEDLYSLRVSAGDLCFMGISREELLNSGGLRCVLRLRYAHRGAAAGIVLKDGVLLATFDEPQRAVTPGQSLVAYDGNHILLSGIIQKR